LGGGGVKLWAAVFFAALFIRLAYLGLAGVPAERLADAASYHAYASQLLELGRYEGLSGERAGRTPGYPLFLVLAYCLFGQSLFGLAVLQCLLGSITCLLIFSVSSKLLPPAWSLACAAAASLYGGLVFPCVLPLSEALYSFSLMFALWALSEGSQKGRQILGGLGLGFSCLVRPELLPVWLLLLPALGRRLALAIFLLVMGLWTARNYVVFNRAIPTTTSGGINLYLGLRLPLNAMHGWAELHHEPAGTPEQDRSAAYMREFKRLWGQTSFWDKLRAYAYNFFTMLYPFLPAYDWTFVAWLPFWLAGLFFSFRRKEWWIIAAAVLASLLVYSVFGGPVSRYRQGISPFLILLGGLGLSELSSRLKPGRFYAASSAWLAFNLLLWAAAEPARSLVLKLKSWLW
jgi:hypothetical protein